MTSAAPARKPYRKAPPQHRETRHTVPSFREEVSESVLPSTSPATSAQPDCFKVILPRNHAPILQRTRFTDTYPQCPERPVWSQVSDSELEVSSLSSSEFKILPPSQIFSYDSVCKRLPSKPQRQQKMDSFIIRSDDQLVLSSDITSSEDSKQGILGSSPSHSSRSVEHSSVLKEQAGILVHRREKHSPHAVSLMHPHPPKGILKQSHQLGVQASDSLRKSKSAETLDRMRSHGRSRKSVSLDRGVGSSPIGRAGSTSSISPTSVPPDWKIPLLEEKIKFSHFLDEITHRVLCPASLKMLGSKLPPASSKGNQTKQQNTSQHSGLRDHQDRNPERDRPWDKWAAQHNRALGKSKGGRAKTWHMSMDSPERVSEKQHTQRAGTRPKAIGPIYSWVGASNGSELDDRSPRGVQRQSKPRQVSHIEGRPQQKHNIIKSGMPKCEIPTIRVEGKKTPECKAFSILSQIKVCV